MGLGATMNAHTHLTVIDLLSAAHHLGTPPCDVMAAWIAAGIIDGPRQEP